MKNLITTVIAGSQYLLHPQKLGTIQETIKPDALIPITLLTTQEIFGDNLEATLERFAKEDDVFVPAFGDVLVEKTSSGNGTNSTNSALSGNRTAYRLGASHFAGLAQINELPSGPYILYGPNLYQAWKLYTDELEAFNFGVIPEDVNKKEEYRALPTLSENGATKAVGVPSRLYFKKPSQKQPLSGVRIAITDAISLKGVDTSLSSRAYSEVYPSADASSSDFASELVQMGAVIVGKTKSASLFSGLSWVDEEKPFNPRGDGYQKPAVNAAGAGSALAGYSWFEEAIGQSSVEGLFDTVALDGVYSLRPTQNDKVLDKVVVSSAQYDTLDLSARSLIDLESLAKATLNTTDAKTPKHIVYPLDFTPTTSEDKKATSEFVQAVETSLSIHVRSLNLAQLWAKNPPKEADTAKLEEYLKEAPFKTYAYDYYHQFDEFRTLYSQRHHDAPFLEAVPQYRWDVGKNITESEYAELSTRLDVFSHWFDKNVASIDGDDTIIILPCQAKSAYRDEDPAPPSSIAGLTPELLSAVLGMPLLAAPFAQVPYVSKISKQTEYRAVCGALMGQKNQELGLLQVLKSAFTAAGWATEVQVGDAIFPNGESQKNIETRADLR